MIKINVVIRDKSWKKQKFNPTKFLEKNVKKINRKINFFKNKKISFSVLLGTSKDIKLLNKKFRNKNKTTDVLSFPFHDKILLKKLLKKKRTHIYRGHSNKYKRNFEKEKKIKL